MQTQTISSKNTALNQIASTFKSKRYEKDFQDASVLDYGCGKGLSRDYCLNTLQVKQWYGWDKYQEAFKENTHVINFLKDTNKKKIITVNNVLNVIHEKDEILMLIAQVSGLMLSQKACNVKCKVIYKIYEGDGSGNGKITKKDCFQRNEKTEVYAKMINKFVSDIEAYNNKTSDNKIHFTTEKHGNFIEVTLQ